MKRLIFILLLAFIINNIYSQNPKKWSIQDCINYAFEHNISLKQKKVLTQKLTNNLKQSKRSRFPNLNASTSFNQSYGRSLNIDNTYTNTDNQSSSFGVSSSLNIFDGLQKKNTIKKREIDLLAQLEEYKQAKEDITLQIVVYYLEILFSKDRLRIAQDQIQITQQQIDRTKVLINEGKLPPRDIIELNSQFALEKAQLVEEDNKLSLSLLDLAQYIDLESINDFDIIVPDLNIETLEEPLENTDEIYRKSLPERHEIKALEYALESSEINQTISKGQRFPTLNFNAGWNTNYYDNYQPSFSNQFKNNASKYWQFSLSIPIFNQWGIDYDIEQAKLNTEDAKLNLENQKNIYYKQIKLAYTNLIAALKKYHSNSLALKASKDAFQNAEEKFNLGLINSFEFSQAKNQYNTAKINLSKARYEYIFQSKILDFYKGIPIKL